MRLLSSERRTQFVAEPKTSDRDRLWIGIIDFKPVISGNRVRHPFVHLEGSWVAERSQCIGASFRRDGEGPIQASRRESSDGKIGGLQTEVDEIQKTTPACGPIK